VAKKMISYQSGGIWHLLKLGQMRGSVFPNSFLLAVPCGAIAAIMKFFIDSGHLRIFAAEDSILRETQAWNGFSFLVGFLVVFRTSQAYNRFWDGCTATHQMRAEWFDACSALVAFCKHSKADDAAIFKFKNMLIRLFSMLHAAALAELEELNHDVEDIDEITAFSFDLIDPAGIDEASLRAVKGSHSKVELLFSWIQFLIVENIDTGVLSIPAPILSRAFQEIANGMVAFHDAVKITYIPFPFPYAQTCDCLLVMHWLVVPFVTSQWVTSPIWAAVFVIIQVFILWSLNFIAVEIENPFGTDANDLDGHYMQKEMNRHLMLLLRPETIRTPLLMPEHCQVQDSHMGVEVVIRSFREVWNDLGEEEMAAFSARKENNFTRAFTQDDEERMLALGVERVSSDGGWFPGRRTSRSSIRTSWSGNSGDMIGRRASLQSRRSSNSPSLNSLASVAETSKENSESPRSPRQQDEWHSYSDQFSEEKASPDGSFVGCGTGGICGGGGGGGGGVAEEQLDCKVGGSSSSTSQAPAREANSSAARRPPAMDPAPRIKSAGTGTGAPRRPKPLIPSLPPLGGNEAQQQQQPQQHAAASGGDAGGRSRGEGESGNLV